MNLLTYGIGSTQDCGSTSGEPDERSEARLRHDLRQSLAAVHALVSVVTSHSHLEAEDDLRLRLVQREVDWMAELLASSDGSAAESVGSQVVDLAQVVVDAWASLAASVSCAVRLRTEAGVHVKADAVALRRSARNLMENAVRAAGSAGRVEVRVSSVDGRAILEVHDDGPGFGRVVPHQGLGLATVRRFLAGCRGYLDVGRSSLGGAQLTLSLPRQGEAWAAERTSA